MSEILSKQTDHGMCEVFLNNGTKCLMAQDGFEYIEDLEEKVKSLESDLSFLRYVSHAHALYWYEQKYKRKREDVKFVKFSGGHGYVMCSVYFSDTDFDYLTEESEAGMILDWAKMKGFRHEP